MRCISPVYVKKARMFVGCGKCNFCLQQKRTSWSFRISQECKRAKSSFFLTLTYDGFKVPLRYVPHYAVKCVYPFELTLNKVDFQLFMKRLRKELEPYTASLPSIDRVRYFAVGEYGEDYERPHYHIIIFNLPYQFEQKIESIWNNGLVHIGTVTAASIHYVTKYVINRHKDYGSREPPFLSCRGVPESVATM